MHGEVTVCIPPPIRTPLEIRDRLDWPWSAGVSTESPIKPEAVSISDVPAILGGGSWPRLRLTDLIGTSSPHQTHFYEAKRGRKMLLGSRPKQCNKPKISLWISFLSTCTEHVRCGGVGICPLHVGVSPRKRGLSVKALVYS